MASGSPALAAPPPVGPPLTREIGAAGAIGLGLGSILGTGVFVSLGIVADVAGPAVILAVVLAALLATANGLSSAQLAAAHPVSGGTYAYGRRFVNPTAGFVAGWMFLAAKSASAATAALGCSGYLLHTLGGSSDSWARVGLALALVFVLTALVASGLRRSNAVNAGILAITLTALVALVAVGWGRADLGRVPQLGADAVDRALSDPAGLLHGTALCFVAFTGYGRIATLGEEVREPQRAIPRAIGATLVVSALLYLGVASAAVLTVGAEAFAQTTRGAAAPLEAVARSLGTPGLGTLVAFGAVSAMAGVLLNLLLGLSRVALAMAREGELPTALATVDASGSPARAVWAVGLGIAALVGIGDVRTTWSFSALTVLVYYGITNLAALRLPAEFRRFPPWIAGVGLVSCAALAVFVPPRIWLFGAGILAVGLALRGRPVRR